MQAQTATNNVFEIQEGMSKVSNHMNIILKYYLIVSRHYVEDLNL
ncbi:hypothetical protein RINTHM_8330 [Richelia intracellularis HM01]|nr:hypothetical protein RINTHM_8330 [Richelia intracellularis HM01]